MSIEALAPCVSLMRCFRHGTEKPVGGRDRLAAVNGEFRHGDLEHEMCCARTGSGVTPHGWPSAKSHLPLRCHWLLLLSLTVPNLWLQGIFQSSWHDFLRSGEVGTIWRRRTWWGGVAAVS